MGSRWAAAIGAAAMAVLATVLTWDMARFEAQPWPANVRAAYTLQIVAGFNAPDMDSVEAGQMPKTVFEAPRFHGPSVFTWPRATLSRLGDCLQQRYGGPPDPDCKDPDTLTRNTNRLVFSSNRDDSRQVSVHAKPLQPGQFEAFGSIYGVKGEIGIGRDFRDASRFAIEIEGRDFQDAPRRSGDAIPAAAGEHNCQPVRAVRPATPLAVALLPGSPVRFCSVQSKDRHSLALLQLPTGFLQRNRRATTLLCKALLKSAVASASPPDFGGCLWANWNATTVPAATLVLFQSLGKGEWALIN